MKPYLIQQIILGTLITLLSVGCAGIARIDGSRTSSAPLPPTQPLPGAAGIGDRYFAELGNGGYDVEHYAIVLDVQPVANVVSGTTTIVAHATQSLSALNLDFVGLTVDDVSVNRDAAKYTRNERELTITAVKPLLPQATFTVVIAYHGSPEPLSSAGWSGKVGWFHTKEGVINVVSEPDGAATWFPVNDHPRDKATYHFEITVPKPFVVAASGLLQETVAHGDKVRYIWEMDKPMASYLAAINVGEYTVETMPGAGRVLVRNYFPRDFQEANRRKYAKLPEMIEFFAGLFGPYPFDAYGVLIADPDNPACESMLAIEVQTLSTHCPEPTAGEEFVIVHELAHQWFGNSVSLVNWQDLWLKEGLATYAQWLWDTRGQEIAAISSVAAGYRRDLILTAPIGQPLEDDLYNYDTVYIGGALVFHALRLHVGDAIFFKILHTYAERFQNGNASTQELIAVATEVSGQDLDGFFQAWLYSDQLPSSPTESQP